MSDKIIEWSAAIQIHEGEQLSGDHYVVCPAPDRVLIAAIDGIGHGPEAAQASQAAVSTIEHSADQPLRSIVLSCHKALRNTRGVVMSLAAFDGPNGSMTWLGVGNVEGRLLRADKSASHRQEELRLHPGVVGHSIPSPLTIGILPIARGDVVILATDGIHREYTEGLHIGKSPHQIANDILAGHRHGVDDALVLVAKICGRQA